MDGKQRSIASSSLMTEEGLYNNGEETVEPQWLLFGKTD
jgi:hypothetical protein